MQHFIKLKVNAYDYDYEECLFSGLSRLLVQEDYEHDETKRAYYNTTCAGRRLWTWWNYICAYINTHAHEYIGSLEFRRLWMRMYFSFDKDSHVDNVKYKCTHEHYVFHLDDASVYLYNI